MDLSFVEVTTLSTLCFTPISIVNIRSFDSLQSTCKQATCRVLASMAYRAAANRASKVSPPYSSETPSRIGRQLTSDIYLLNSLSLWLLLSWSAQASLCTPGRPFEQIVTTLLELLLCLKKLKLPSLPCKRHPQLLLLSSLLRQQRRGLARRCPLQACQVRLTFM